MILICIPAASIALSAKTIRLGFKFHVTLGIYISVTFIGGTTLIVTQD